MNIWNKTKQLGFTLIELVIVIVILGILAAIAIPRFVDLSTSAKNAAAAGFEGAVKSAHSIYIASNSGAFPTVTQLAGQIQGSGVTAAASGIRMTIGTTGYIVPTYTAADCTGATGAVGNSVLCVGTVTSV